MHISTDESLSWKTDEEGIFLTGGRSNKMTSEIKDEIETNIINPLESCYGSWRLGNQ